MSFKAIFFIFYSFARSKVLVSWFFVLQQLLQRMSSPGKLKWNSFGLLSIFLKMIFGHWKEFSTLFCLFFGLFGSSFCFLYFVFVFVCMFSYWSFKFLFLVLFWSFWCFLVATRVEGARIIIFNGFFLFFLVAARVRVGGTRFYFYFLVFFGVFSCYKMDMKCKNCFWFFFMFFYCKGDMECKNVFWFLHCVFL